MYTEVPIYMHITWSLYVRVLNIMGWLRGYMCLLYITN